MCFSDVCVSATAYSTVVGDRHTKPSLLPTPQNFTNSLHGYPTPLPLTPPRDALLFFLSNTHVQAAAGCRGFCLLGTIPSRIHLLPQPGSAGSPVRLWPWPPPGLPGVASALEFRFHADNGKFLKGSHQDGLESSVISIPHHQM